MKSRARFWHDERFTWVVVGFVGVLCLVALLASPRGRGSSQPNPESGWSPPVVQGALLDSTTAPAQPADGISFVTVKPRQRPTPSGLYEKVDFMRLSDFKYGWDDTPSGVTELDGRKIAVTGSMMPIEVDKGVIKSFALINGQMGCCYGMMPRINEVIFVQCPGFAAQAFSYYQPVQVFGKLSVGAETKDGALVSFYRMQADEVHEAM